MLPFSDGVNPIIYLEEEGCFAVIAQQNSFFSVVAYYKDGVYYERYIENDFL